MIIKQLTLEAFGKFKQKTIDLSTGLHIIEGLNESGKTTIHAFIEGMLYGFFKPGASRKTYLDSWEKFKPKKGSAYQGNMIVSHQKTTYRIERDFRKRGGYLKLFNEQTGQDLTEQFDVDNTTKQIDLGLLFDMPYGLYTNTLSVSESDRALNGQAEDDLIRRLQNLNSSALETVSTDRAIKHIDQTLKEEIGTDNARTKPYAKAKADLAALETEKEEALAHHQSLLTLKTALDETKDNHQKLLKEEASLKENLKQHQNTLKKQTLNDIIHTVSGLNVVREDDAFKQVTAFLKTCKQHDSLFESLDTRHQTLNDAQKEIAMLQTNIEQENNTINDREYEHIKADKQRHDTLKTHEKSDEIKENKREIDSIASNLKTKERAIQNTKKTRITVSLSLVILVLISVAITYSQMLGVQALYGFIGLLLPVISWVYLTNIFKKQTQEIGTLSDTYDKLKRDVDRDEKSHQEAKRALERLYQKHQCVDEDDFIQKYYQAETKHQNFERIKRWQNLIVKHQAQIEENIQTLSPLFNVFNLDIKPINLPTLLKIKGAYLQVRQSLAGQSFKDFYDSIDLDLPDIHDVNQQQIERDLKHIQQTITQSLEDMSRQEATYQEKLTLTRDMTLIEYDLAQKEAIILDLEQSRDILQSAKSMIEKAADHIEENFAPVLSRHIAELLPALTNQQYHELKVRRNLDFKLYVPATASLESTPYFSKGTLEQIYVAIRLGILKSLGKTDVPLILDDAFVHFDDERLSDALDLLTKHGTPQCLIFTCQSREKTWVNKHNIPHSYIQL